MSCKFHDCIAKRIPGYMHPELPQLEEEDEKITPKEWLIPISPLPFVSTVRKQPKRLHRLLVSTRIQLLMLASDPTTLAVGSVRGAIYKGRWHAARLPPRRPRAIEIEK